MPGCSVCGGTLKPDIVFFGEFVPLGLAAKRRIPIIVVNRGETKADARAAVKIDAGTTESLAALRDALLA